VDRFWIAAAVVGGSVPTIAFIVALFWWLKCKPLWKADEDDEGHLEEPVVELSGLEQPGQIQQQAGSEGVDMSKSETANTAWLQ